MVEIGNPKRPDDPDNIPVRVINWLPQIGIVGNSIALTLTTDRGGFTSEGKHQVYMVVAARLRMDREMARILRDALTTHIDLLTPPPNKGN
ncbi:hypothetical protein [Ancylobacter oerskovii]|uniref:Uncharacterized protein n=1 Tax=Ancylobacter oerskovii TaxID=459519 RepID=A0ABW4Z558_9HYPH|nr:hypothetical protein [Ancylobacter oerskovii]MBS7543032.1 hypothetical protein [Ancylobacter oerskovii]